MIVALVGTFDGVIVNILVSAYHTIGRLLGGTADPSHGVISYLVLLVMLIGSFAVLRWPLFAAIALLVSGIAFFFVVHAWALLVSPQVLVAAWLGFLDWNQARNAWGSREGNRRSAAPVA